jgi:hypothetical protein
MISGYQGFKSDGVDAHLLDERRREKGANQGVWSRQAMSTTPIRVRQRVRQNPGRLAIPDPSSSALNG